MGLNFNHQSGNSNSGRQSKKRERYLCAHVAPIKQKIKLLSKLSSVLQCAFDIVTPTEVSLVADAEVLCVADKILQVKTSS